MQTLPAQCALVSQHECAHLDAELHYSLVLACYCDAPHLLKNVQCLIEYLTHFDLSFEILFVEDASPDNTLEELEKCHDFLVRKNIPHIVMRNLKNVGRGGSVQSGFEIARGRVVGFIDVDLEHLPDAIPLSVLRILKKECHAIVARRIYSVRKTRPIRALASAVYKRLVHLTLTLPVSDSESGFKFFDREQLSKVLPMVENKGWFWDTEIVFLSALCGLKFAEQNIVFERNLGKQSTVRIVQDSLEYLRELRKFVKRIEMYQPMIGGQLTSAPHSEDLLTAAPLSPTKGLGYEQPY